MKSIRLSLRSARALRDANDARAPGRDRVGPFPGEARAWEELAAGIAAATRVRPARTATRKAKASKRATKREETAAIRAAVMERAAGKCEACFLSFGPLLTPELDHFFGRARVPQAVSNCWALCRVCHRNKTDGSPSPEEWCGRFISHCQRYGYAAEASRARTRLHFSRVRRTLVEVSAP